LNTHSKHLHTKLIKQKAKDLGFDYCGISKAGFLEDEAPRLEQWLLISISQEDYSQARIKLESLPSGIVDLDDWKTLKSFQLNSLETSGSAFIDLSLAREYLDNDNQESNQLAQSIFEASGAIFPMRIPKPKEVVGTKSFEYFEVQLPKEYMVYPNPASRYIRVHIPNTENIELYFELLNSSGKTVVSEIFNQEKEDALIQLPQLSDGIYSYKISKLDNRIIHSGSVLIHHQ